MSSHDADQWLYIPLPVERLPVLLREQDNRLFQLFSTHNVVLSPIEKRVAHTSEEYRSGHGGATEVRRAVRGRREPEGRFPKGLTEGSMTTDLVPRCAALEK